MKHAIGIDVGGTKIAGVLIDEHGRIKKKLRVTTEAHKGAQHVLKRIGEVTCQLQDEQTIGCGIALPGYLYEGKLYSCPNIPDLEGKPLLQLLHRQLKLPLHVENDANCFALAEHAWGAGAGRKNMIGLVIGTGIGTGIIIDDKIYEGSKGGAGELGHIPFGESDLEEFLAGPGIIKRYESHGGKYTKFSKIFDGKDKAGRVTTEETVQALAWLISIINKAYDPELVVLGGGVSRAPIMEKVKKKLKEMGEEVNVKKNELGDDSGVIGAARMVLMKKRKH